MPYKCKKPDHKLAYVSKSPYLCTKLNLFIYSNNMCTKPIYIWNNSIDQNGVHHRVKIAVPCGKCEECLQHRHAHYKLRAYYEQLGVEAVGGVTLFDTLTYTDENLPHLNGVPCFDHRDIIKFRKRLDINLQRSGYTAKLRSFIVSEFGGTTHRPHYHIMCFYHGPIDPHVLHDHIRKAWGLGFTDKQTKRIEIAKSGVGAIHYTTKYMCKSECEIADEAKFYVMRSTGSTTDPNLTYKEYKHIVETTTDERGNKCFKNQSWISRGFGDYLLEKIETDYEFARSFMETGKVRMPNAKGGKCPYSLLPLGHFYTYKLFYDRVFNERTGRKDRYVLNERGKDWKIDHLDNIIDSVKTSLEKNIGKVDSKVVHNLLDGHTLEEMAIYNVCYSGVTGTIIDMCSYKEDYRIMLTPNEKNPVTPENEDTFPAQQYRQEQINKLYCWQHHLRGDDTYMHFEQLNALILSALAAEQKQKDEEFKQKQRTEFIARSLRRKRQTITK